MTTTCTPPTRTVATTPRYQVTRQPENWTVSIDLPGVPKDQVSVSHEKNLLTVEGRRGTSPTGWKALHRELTDVDFRLVLRLHELADSERLSASMADGVLTLSVPVKESAKPRQIAVA